MKILFTHLFFLAIFYGLPLPEAMAQFDDDVPEQVLRFSVNLEPEAPRPGEHARVVVTLDLHPGWHVYSIIPAEGEFPPITTLLKMEPGNMELIGPVYETQPVTAHDPVLEQVLNYHEEKGRLFQNLRILERTVQGELISLSGSLRYQACSDRVCLPPKTDTWTLSAILGGGPLRNEFSTPQYAVDQLRPVGAELEEALKEGLLAFLLLAGLSGLLALLTPCVFPMIPVTVAFFSKQESGGRRNTLKLATLFGAGIVGTYTLTGMGLSAFLGASGAVRFATNGWVNLAIGALFTLFAFSLMGFFEFQLPAAFGSRADRWSRTLSGPLGVIAMGFAFTLTSFTCTVQFVGTLIVAASEGQWFWPVTGMLVFATVFAFPFFLLGLFPKLISTFHSSSGDWMQNLKIVLGILELAAAFKFFSNSDLVWNWGVLDREFLLATWTLLCGISALFLFGMIPIHHTRISKIGPYGFSTALVFLLLGLYFTRGIGGSPLNPWVETYLPPKLSQPAVAVSPSGAGAVLLSHSLPWNTNLKQALVQARKEDKYVFIDFTGYTCVNCRWMEKNIFSEPRVMDLFRSDFILVQLYTDGGKDAIANQELQVKRFKTVALPLYVVLDSGNRLLARHAGILEPAGHFLRFLQLQESG